MNATGQGMLKKDDLISVYVVVMVDCLGGLVWVLQGNVREWELGVLASCWVDPGTPGTPWFGTESRHLSSGDTFPTKRCVPRQGTKVYVFFSQLSTDGNVMWPTSLLCEPGNAH